MTNKRLNIISEGSQEVQFGTPSSFPSRLARKKEMQAKFERLWLMDPEQFNPLRNCMQRERLARTWELLTHHTSLSNKKVADMGCGAGVFSRQLRDGGAMVEAIDIAANALKSFRQGDMHHIEAKQDAMPTTALPDHSYDVIVCTEMIAELSPEDYRLFFAELARLIKADGCLICSSAIDIDSEGGVERLIALAQTEFDVVASTSSYHALYLKLKRLCQAPFRFIEAWKSPPFRQQELAQRKGVKRWWFYSQTSFFFIWIWLALAPLLTPLLAYIKNSRSLLLRLEKICQLIWDESGVSHFIFLAKKRPLRAMDPREVPVEKPRRKEIWN